MIDFSKDISHLAIKFIEDSFIKVWERCDEPKKENTITT